MATIPFITVEDVKQFVDGGLTDSSNDQFYNLILAGVCLAVEEHIRRPVIAREITERLDGNGRANLVLKPTILSVSSIKENDTALAETEYLVRKETGFITRLCATYTAGKWCKGTGNVEVVYTAGLAATAAEVPEDVKLAAIIAWKFYYQTGPMDYNARIEGGTMIKPENFPRAARFLLDPYRAVSA